MLFELMKILFISAIAIPFVYIVSASIFDIVKKIYEFYKTRTTPLMVRVEERINK